MSEEIVPLWEIFVPADFAMSYHEQWDRKVTEITNGLTVYSAVTGRWLSKVGCLRERMIPVRIACSQENIRKIADIVAEHYKQEAVMYYLVSEQVYVRRYSKECVVPENVSIHKLGV